MTYPLLPALVKKSHLNTSHLWLIIGIVGLAGLFAPPVRAEDKKPDFSKGAIYGKVVDTATNKPVPDATVAITDKNGKILAWTKTDDKGEYAIATDPLKVLLHPSHRRGLLEEVCKQVGDVAMAPVKVAVGVVKQPGQTVRSAAESVALGNPAPLAATAVGPLLSNPKDVKNAAAQQSKEAAVKTALGDNPQSGAAKKDDTRGEVMVLVTAPNYKDAKGQAGATWMEPADKVDNKQIGPRAWLETCKLAPTAGDKKSEIVQEALMIAEPHLEPALAPAGSVIKISCKLTNPTGQARKVRLFARENKKKAVVELKPGANNVYTGELTLDPKTPSGETKIAIVALREDPVEVKIDKNKEKAFAEFVKRLDDLDSDKPYLYDPRIMASENRADLTVTVLDPKQATPKK
jgi:hypothetical protein